MAGYASSGASFNDDNGDAKVKAAKANADAAVAAIFDGGNRPASPEHRSLRMLLTGDWFPVKEQAAFDGDLGDFSLEEGEKAPAAPSNSPPAALPDRALGDKANKKWKRHSPGERKGADKKAEAAPPKPAPAPPSAQDPAVFLPRDEGEQPATVVEAAFDKIKVQLVWGGEGASSPWGLLAKLIEQAGGSVQYTYLHAADLIRKRNEPFEKKEESDG